MQMSFNNVHVCGGVARVTINTLNAAEDERVETMSVEVCDR